MSLPKFPDRHSHICREDAINYILTSIAMEELGLSHIINAEGEKIQYVLGTLPGITGPNATVEDVLAVNDSVRDILDSTLQNQLVLKAKMDQALSHCCLHHPCGTNGSCCDNVEPCDCSDSCDNTARFCRTTRSPASTKKTACLETIAYGGKYATGSEHFHLLPNCVWNINMPFAMPTLQTTLTPVNSLTVNTAGVYELHFSLGILSASEKSLLSVHLLQNSEVIQGTQLKKPVSSDHSTMFYGTIITNLNAKDIISMGMLSSIEIDITLDDEVNALFTIKKIN